MNGRHLFFLCRWSVEDLPQGFNKPLETLFWTFKKYYLSNDVWPKYARPNPLIKVKFIFKNIPVCLNSQSLRNNFIERCHLNLAADSTRISKEKELQTFWAGYGFHKKVFSNPVFISMQWHSVYPEYYSITLPKFKCYFWCF